MSNIQHCKYPRTAHVPWSPGATEDDVIIDTVDCFAGREVVVTEKMDGENTTMYKDNQRICGENMFWVHSLVYTKLKAYFLMFNAWEDSTCLSWDDTKLLADKLGLTLVPELYRGTFDVDTIKELWGADKWSTMEGYVVRVVEPFERDGFQQSVAKFVRKDHVQTDEHWLRSGGELNMLRL